jgi:hypothetical protein
MVAIWMPFVAVMCWNGLFLVAIAEERGWFAENDRTIIVFWSIFCAERKYSDALP